MYLQQVDNTISKNQVLQILYIPCIIIQGVSNQSKFPTIIFINLKIFNNFKSLQKQEYMVNIRYLIIILVLIEYTKMRIYCKYKEFLKVKI